jgi:hypothetical protein
MAVIMPSQTVVGFTKNRMQMHPAAECTAGSAGRESGRGGPEWRWIRMGLPESGRQSVTGSIEDPRLLDDFELIAERAQVTQILAALTDQYRRLTHEMNQRTTLRWMLR